MRLRYGAEQGGGLVRLRCGTEATVGGLRYDYGAERGLKMHRDEIDFVTGAWVFDILGPMGRMDKQEQMRDKLEQMRAAVARLNEAADA